MKEIIKKGLMESIIKKDKEIAELGIEVRVNRPQRGMIKRHKEIIQTHNKKVRTLLGSKTSY